MIIVIGVCQIIFTKSGLFNYLVPGYLIFFGFLMMAGDIEVKAVLSICGFLGNFYGRAIFTVYCGVNILIFSAVDSTNAISAVSSICGWVCIVFGFVLACLKLCTKSDSLLSQEMETYMQKQRG